MSILVEIRSVYGNKLFYPVCAQATLFADLIGKKTFTLAHLRTIELLGFKVEFKQEVINL